MDQRDARRRPSAPFGNPAWMQLSVSVLSLEVDRSGRRVRPELFRMIARYRSARIRLAVETVLMVAAIVVFAVLPSLGILIVMVIIAIPGFFDLLLVIDLRRRITEAWQDFALGDLGQDLGDASR